MLRGTGQLEVENGREWGMMGQHLVLVKVEGERTVIKIIDFPKGRGSSPILKFPKGKLRTSGQAANY